MKNLLLPVDQRKPLLWFEAATIILLICLMLFTYVQIFVFHVGVPGYIKP